MPDLIAQGPSSEDRWRRELPDPTSGIDVVIGRTDVDWPVPWDSMISRAHIRVRSLSDDRIEVHCMPSARNPVFHQGRQADRFKLVPGDHFVIGKTTFTLVNRPGASADLGNGGDVTEHAFDHVMLRRRHFRDSAARIEMLSRLPDLITGSSSDEELLVRVTGVLLRSTPMAGAVAIVAVADSENRPQAAKANATTQHAGDVRVLHYDSRTDDRDSPAVSARLVRTAVAKRESVLHLWSSHRPEAVAFTADEGSDWAFCVPLRSEACPGWAIYMTGRMSTQMPVNPTSSDPIPGDLQDDVKFAELVGTTIANLRQSRRLQRRQSELKHFFAPVVMDAMAGRDPDDVLRPREADLSVMFCDLRGFSRRSERDSHDLLELLARVSDALGVMTRHILRTDGVIGDFHGDAAMGFWGWPLDQSDMAIRAARAAAGIRAQYRNDTVGGFRCGIGIATGRAVAGRIGTVDQVKVTAFGPVVNLASRLEGITKAFGAEVIVDPNTAEQIRRSPGDEFRVRRLAKVRPAGMEQSVMVSELIDTDHPGLVTSDDQIATYENGLDAMIDGRWDEAHMQLQKLPPDDPATDVLMSTLLRSNRVPPADWNGAIELPKL